MASYADRFEACVWRTMNMVRDRDREHPRIPHRADNSYRSQAVGP